jgi:hypothetical protein
MEEKIIVQEDLSHKAAYEVTVRTHKTYRMIFFLLGVLEVFLAIRFLFKLFGANPGSWFVAFVYGVSGTLLFPFSGVFRGGSAVGEGIQRVFEPSTLVAMLIYLLVAWGASRLLLIIRSKPLDQ